MNTTKHTGPWIDVPTTAPHKKGTSIRRDIVTTSGEWNPAFVAGDILPEDARLIASAPALVEALQRIVNGGLGATDTQHAIMIARAALRSAGIED